VNSQDSKKDNPAYAASQPWSQYMEQYGKEEYAAQQPSEQKPSAEAVEELLRKAGLSKQADRILQQYIVGEPESSDPMWDMSKLAEKIKDAEEQAQQSETVSEERLRELSQLHYYAWLPGELNPSQQPFEVAYMASELLSLRAQLRTGSGEQLLKEASECIKAAWQISQPEAQKHLDDAQGRVISVLASLRTGSVDGWVPVEKELPVDGQHVWYFKGKHAEPRCRCVYSGQFHAGADFPFNGDGPSVSHWMAKPKDPAPPSSPDAGKEA
jgi:hypothetical protein